MVYRLMDGFVKYFVFAEDQQDDERHINVVRVTVGGMVQRP